MNIVVFVLLGLPSIWFWQVLPVIPVLGLLIWLPLQALLLVGSLLKPDYERPTLVLDAEGIHRWSKSYSWDEIRGAHVRVKYLSGLRRRVVKRWLDIELSNGFLEIIQANDQTASFQEICDAILNRIR